MREANRPNLSAVAVLAIFLFLYAVWHAARLYWPEIGGHSDTAEIEQGGLIPDHLPPGPALEALHKRAMVKAQLATEVLAGKRSFWDAVAAYRELHPDEQSRLLLLRLCHPGATEEEAFARNLIQFLRGAARDDPQKQAEVTVMEQELEIAVDNGNLPIPE
jgi:hypothetical protein